MQSIIKPAIDPNSEPLDILAGLAVGMVLAPGGCLKDGLHMRSALIAKQLSNQPPLIGC